MPAVVAPTQPCPLGYRIETKRACYSIEGVLGRGAYGVVYRVRDQKTNQAYAMKKVTADSCGILELDVLRATTGPTGPRHPFVLWIEDWVLYGTELYLVLPLLERLAEVKASAADHERWFREAVTGVAYLASLGVYHMDLSVNNLLLAANGDGSYRCVLADYSHVVLVHRGVGTMATSYGHPHRWPPEVIATGGRLATPAWLSWNVGILARQYYDFLGYPFLPRSLVGVVRRLLEPATDRRGDYHELALPGFPAGAEYTPATEPLGDEARLVRVVQAVWQFFPDVGSQIALVDFAYRYGALAEDARAFGCILEILTNPGLIDVPPQLLPALVAGSESMFVRPTPLTAARDIADLLAVTSHVWEPRLWRAWRPRT